MRKVLFLLLTLSTFSSGSLLAAPAQDQICDSGFGYYGQASKQDAAQRATVLCEERNQDLDYVAETNVVYNLTDTEACYYFQCKERATAKPAPKKAPRKPFIRR